MAQVNNSPELPDMKEIAAEARSLVRRSTKGSLATLDAPSRAPYASLITLATEADGSPVFLISTLARHTRNLAADPRAAILVDGTASAGFSRARRRPRFMSIFQIFRSGGCRSKALISSAVSGASSIWRPRICSFRWEAPRPWSRPRRKSWRI